MNERVLLCLCSDGRDHELRRALLEETGYEVLTATSAAEALEMLRFRRFSALVVDDPGYAEITPFRRKVRELAGALPLVVAPDDPSRLRRLLDPIVPAPRRAA